MKAKRLILTALGPFFLALTVLGAGRLAGPALASLSGRYPNSMQGVSEGVNLLSIGRGYISHDGVYRTDDDLTTVTAWYAGRYGIEPGHGFYAQGQCVRLSTATGYVIVHRTVAVMLCAMPHGTRVYFNQVFYPGP